MYPVNETDHKGKRVQVSFTREQWRIIERFKETLGATDADLVRNIVLAWLAEKSIIATDVKRKMEDVG